MRGMERPRSNRKIVMSADMRDFLRRRTLPFLDSIGVDRPLSFVLEEVYLQGMRDAVQTMEHDDANLDSETLV